MDDAASPTPEVVRFLHAAGSGIPCSLVKEELLDVSFTVVGDSFELLRCKEVFLRVPLGYLRTCQIASEDLSALPETLSEAWADCAVHLQFFQDTDLRSEFLLLGNDVEAAILCRSLAHLQRFGIAPDAASRARAAFAALSSPDIERAMQRWRAGMSWKPAQPAPLSSSLSSFAPKWQLSDFIPSWRSNPDPSLACGWDVPQPFGADVLEAEGELSERWRKAIGGRDPSALTQSELRAVFALGDRIPWQYRFALWPLWLGVQRSSGTLEDAQCAVGEDCKRQIEKDMNRTRPNELSSRQVDALGRVLRAYAARFPAIGYCQGMNFIVAVCLLAGFTEEQAVGGLASLVGKFLDGYYEHSMGGVLRDVAVLDALLSLMLPAIHARLVEINLPLIWIAAEPFLTLFSRGAPLESVCRLWDFFLIEGSCATFAVFLAYAELAQERNLLEGTEAEDALGAFTLLLGDAGAIAAGLLRRAAQFLAPRPFGSGLNEQLLTGLRQELSASR